MLQDITRRREVSVVLMSDFNTAHQSIERLKFNLKTLIAQLIELFRTCMYVCNIYIAIFFNNMNNYFLFFKKLSGDICFVDSHILDLSVHILCFRNPMYVCEFLLIGVIISLSIDFFTSRPLTFELESVSYIVRWSMRQLHHRTPIYAISVRVNNRLVRCMCHSSIDVASLVCEIIYFTVRFIT